MKSFNYPIHQTANLLLNLWYSCGIYLPHVGVTSLQGTKTARAEAENLAKQIVCYVTMTGYIAMKKTLTYSSDGSNKIAP
jgi:hypothetical protein